MLFNLLKFRKFDDINDESYSKKYWLRNFLAFNIFNILVFFLYFSFYVANPRDLFGVQELNFWNDFYKSYDFVEDLNFSSVTGNNYYWIKLLSNFNLLPINSLSDILKICLLSKIIQFVFFGITFRFIGKLYWVIYIVYLIPSNFLTINAVGRSSMDLSIICAIGVISFVQPLAAIFLSLFSFISKYLLSFLGLLGILIEHLRLSKRFKFLILILFYSFSFVYFMPIFIKSINTSYEINFLFGSYGENFNDFNPNNIFDYILRSVLILFPPIFFKFNSVTLLISSGHFIFYGFFYFFRKYITLDFLNFLFIFSIFASPAIFNLITGARYVSLVYSYLLITLAIKSKINLDKI